jgi:hypothetical protein
MIVFEVSSLTMTSDIGFDTIGEVSSQIYPLARHSVSVPLLVADIKTDIIGSQHSENAHVVVSSITKTICKDL